MSHILKDGQRFNIDVNGNTIVRNAAGDEIVKDGTVARVPFYLTDSTRKAPPPVFDERNHRPGYIGARSALAATADAAKAQASHQRMQDRKASAWKHPEPVRDDAASDLAPAAPKPAAPGETVRSQDAAWEAMKRRKAAAWEKTT